MQRTFLRVGSVQFYSADAAARSLGVHLAGTARTAKLVVLQQHTCFLVAQKISARTNVIASLVLTKDTKRAARFKKEKRGRADGELW